MDDEYKINGFIQLGAAKTPFLHFVTSQKVADKIYS